MQGIDLARLDGRVSLEMTLRDDGFGATRYSRGAVARFGCAPSSGTVSLDIQAMWGSGSDTSRIHELGHGPYSIQVHTGTLTAKQLAQKDARDKADLRRQRARSDEYYRELCASCGQKYRECRAGIRAPRASCEVDFGWCGPAAAVCRPYQ